MDSVATLKEIIETARAYESRITDDLVDRIASHPEAYDVAALTDPDKEAEMNGGEGR